jgi:hypothetical protein
MIEAIHIGYALGGLAAGLGFGAAAVLREHYRGKIGLIRARRGDPELPVQKPTLPSLRRKS